MRRGNPALIRNVPNAGSFVQFMSRVDAHHGTRVGVAALLVLALGLVNLDNAGASYRSHPDPLVESGELYVSPTRDAVDVVAVSGQTAVAAGATTGEAYVFSEPASGWSTEAQVATLIAPDSLGRAVAISGDTIVVDAPGATVGSNIEEGAVYVFEKPSGGWSDDQPQREADPLRPRSPRGFGFSLAISGSTVVMGASKPGSGSGGAEFTAGVAYVFSKPTSGWVGTLHDTAQLVPSGAGELWQLPAVSISGQTVVANGHIGGKGVDYLFREPPTGWAGIVPQRGMLVPSSGHLVVGPVQIAGDSIFATGSSTSVCPCAGNLIDVFRAPSPGWAGNERQSATLMFNSPPPAAVWLAASLQTAAVATLSECPRNGACGGSIWTFAEPRGGWSAQILAAPAARRTSSSVGVGLALSGKTLFFAHGTDTNSQYGAVSLYTVNGTSQFAPPTVSRVSLTRLTRGSPRLHFKLSASLGAPAIKAITVKLPTGLTFAHSRKDIRRGVSLDRRRPFTIQCAPGAIVLTLKAARGSVSVNVTSRALRESRSLLARMNALITFNRMRQHHKKHMRLTLLVATRDTQSFVVQLPVIIKEP